MKRSAVVNLGLRYGAAGLSLVSMLIMARVLEPVDFGIVAFLNSLTTLFVVLANVGLAPAVIQFKDLDSEALASAYTLSLWISGALSLLLIVAVVPTFILLGFGSSLWLAFPAGLSSFLGMASGVPTALLMRDGRLVELGFIQLIATGVSVLVSISCALLGVGAGALVFGQLALQACLYLACVLKARPRVTSSLSLKHLAPVRQFSAFDFGANISYYAARNMDNVLVGAIAGPVPLGYYSQAYQLSVYPVTYSTFLINPLLHPLLARYQDRPSTMAQLYLPVVRVLTGVGLLFSSLGVVAAGEIVSLVLGNRWQMAVTPFRLLSVSIVFQVASSTVGPVFRSLGDTRRLFYSSLMSSGVILTFICVGSWTGNIIVIAAMVSAGFACKFVVEFFMLWRYGFGLSPLSFFRGFVWQLSYLTVFISFGFVLAIYCPSVSLLSFLVKTAVVLASWFLFEHLIGDLRWMKGLMSHARREG